MERKQILITAVLLFLLTSAAAFSGCGGAPEESDNLTAQLLNLVIVWSKL